MSSQRLGCVWSWMLFILFFIVSLPVSPHSVMSLNCQLMSHTFLFCLKHPETSNQNIAFRSQWLVLSCCSAACSLCLCEKSLFFILSWTTVCSLGSDLQSDSFIVRLMMDGEFVNVDLSVLYLNMHQYFCHVVQNCSHSEHVKHGSLLGGCTLPGFDAVVWIRRCSGELCAGLSCRSCRIARANTE